MTELEMKEWIGEIQTLHSDVIWKANEKNITDRDQFSDWAAKMAQLHTQITLSLILGIQKADEKN